MFVLAKTPCDVTEEGGKKTTRNLPRILPSPLLSYTYFSSLPLLATAEYRLPRKFQKIKWEWKANKKEAKVKERTKDKAQPAEKVNI